MRSIKIAIIATLLTTNVNAKTISIAVIDTGFDMNSSWSNTSKLNVTKPKICKNGHYNFVSNNEDVEDNHGHGTHIAGIIARDNQKIDYCLVILKYFDPKVPNTDNLANTIAAIYKAIDLKVDAINYSGGGTEFSYKECKAVKTALNHGIKFIAAAGNEASNLDKHPYYPALCDSRIHVVQNVDSNGQLARSSNYSKTKYSLYSAVGVNVLSLLPHNNYGYMTGTSQSTAVITRKIVKQLAYSQEEMNRAHCSKNYINQVICEMKYKEEVHLCKE